MPNHQEQIDTLRAEIKALEGNIKWYQRTYENRKLAGILKDRMVNYYSKAWTKEGADLETRIQRYIAKNPLNIKKNLGNDAVSIIMLSYNRIEDTRKSVKNIFKYTTVPFELIILDNNSAAPVREELKGMARKYKNIKIVLETVNLGCAGGRMKALKFAKHNHLLFLDNDILVTPYYVENLFASLHSDESIAGVCCKVVFPNGKIQFNGGRMQIDDEYALFSLADEGMNFDDNETNRFIDCQWIPGGATLWRKDLFVKFGIDMNMKGSFEDNEVSLRMINSGYKLMNSPVSIVIHDHYDFKDTSFKKAESEYYAGRNNESRIKAALLHFYNTHKLIFSFSWKNNPWDIMWALNSKEEIKKFIRENNHPK